MPLERLLEIVATLQSQGIFTAQQATRLTDAANAMLTTFANAEEYAAKYNLFLALLNGKWI